MTFGTIQNSFIAGEISPELYGRTDLAKWKNGASTMRNCFVNYRGGASSRAGTAYIGTCKQSVVVNPTGPPRTINFQFNINQGYALEFGDQYMRIVSNGGYVTEATKNITGITAANPGVFTSNAHGYSNGDWVFISGVSGMTNFNGLTWIVANATTNTFTVTDLFGNAVDTSAFSSYTSGGTAARIYTVVSPYAAIDLIYLKFTQSADTMSLTCVNTVTDTEYPPYDLKRNGATNWTFTPASFSTGINAPTGVVATAQSSTTVSTFYSYLVTAVNAAGEESAASISAGIENNDISINAGSNTITWNPVSGAVSYNVYKATPAYGAQVPAGSNYGFMAQAFGTQCTDGNIQADFTVVPPTHNDPFARGAIAAVGMTANGTGYSQSSVACSISTSTGSGFVGLPIVVSGAVVAVIIQNAGSGYVGSDTISFSGAGGSGATATLTLGAATGTYPGVVAYYQQRRFYANTLDSPDTYYASKPGLYLNMDTSTPVQDNDAITGTPWAQQIDGIQFLVPMPGGLVILTGKGAWQLNGGSTAALTPSDETATPQAYNGCSNIVPPIVVNYDILYVQSKGSIVRDLAYNFFVNIYTGTDLTVLSNHLFTGHQILQWAYCEEPYKLAWAVREDGTLLSLTYLKEQDVYGWARHDTNGLYLSVCSVTEPPVDALYCIVQRYVQSKWMYYMERMNNRQWANVEQCFCVDAGLTWPMASPSATLSASQAAIGTGVTFTASSSVFNSGMVGNVIRMGGGKATVTAYVSGTQLTATITEAITATVPNDPNNTVIPQVSGSWTITPTTTTITGLNHLNGLTVAILADGGVLPQQVVANNSITLPQACSAISVGLPYLPQLQTLYLEVPSQHTVQGKRKNIYSATIRVSSSRGISVGSNQPDAATQPNTATVAWTNMIPVADRTPLMPAGVAIPLLTGDQYLPIPGDWETQGQVAVQQSNPLPMNVLAVIANYAIGDTDG